MSFSLTRAQIRDGSKTVTRRVGWKDLQPGERICAVEKVMGLAKGEQVVRLAVIEVVSVRTEPLEAIDAADVAREGFGGWTPAQFVECVCRHVRGLKPESLVQRIEFRKVRDWPAPASKE